MTTYDYQTGRMEWPDRDDIYNRAARLILAATGEPWGDGMIVTGIGSGFADPSYGGEDDLWVTGDWNTRQPWEARQAGLPLTPHESLPARLGRALERVGVELLWLDEWSECQDCYKIVRSSPDSYSYRPPYAHTEDGFYCAACMVAYGEIPEEYVDNPSNAITWADPSDLETWGWERYVAGGGESWREGVYETGWHAGQNDNPSQVLEEIKRAHPSAQVVFLYEHPSQFYVGWSAWIRFDEDRCRHCAEYLLEDDTCDCEGGLNDAT